MRHSAILKGKYSERKATGLQRERERTGERRLEIYTREREKRGILSAKLRSPHIVRGLLLQRHTLAAGVTVDTRLCYVAPCSDDGFAAVTSLPLRRAADLVPTSYRRDQASTNPVQQRPITRAAPIPDDPRSAAFAIPRASAPQGRLNHYSLVRS
ncbi:hypothetical protein ACJRO7_017161 [Eucalyptus globulus]|uniref:Uncharacterized protein n=1 Tax=Eucalyptus globulus TaxID=34317 RepID=A0ABD3KVS2_EUCGL